MNKESIGGTVLMIVGFLIIPIGFAVPSIMMLGVYSFIAGAVLLFVSNIKVGTSNNSNKEKQLTTQQIEEAKKVFYEKTKPLFEEKLMYEIYSSEKISVCNLCNEDYCVFSFASIILFGQVIGVLFNKDVIGDIVNHNEKFDLYVVKCGKKYLDKCMVSLTPKWIEVMRQIKAENDIKGPGTVIDHEWEEHIRNRM